MRYEVTSIVIVDEKMYRGNGIVAVWGRKLVADFTRHAVAKAPVRSGELIAGIHNTFRSSASARTITGTIQSDAPHSMFVLAGTTGPIYADSWEDGKPGRLRLRPGMSKKGKGGSAEVTWRYSVDGQEANNFLMKAWVATGRNHSSIRRVMPTSFGQTRVREPGR